MNNYSVEIPYMVHIKNNEVVEVLNIDDVWVAPEDENGMYLELQVGDEVINGRFYRNGEPLTSMKD